MSSNPPGQPLDVRPHWSAELARSQKQIDTALLVLAALAAIIPIGLGIYYKQSAFGPVFFWGCALTLVFFGGAMASMSYRPADVSPGERVRILLMGVIGSAGLATALAGFWMVFHPSWAPLLGGMEAWAENRGLLLSVAGCIFGGLTMMFLGLLIVSGMERSHQSIRWLVFGFNTVFSALLLFFVLGLINMLAYAEPVDRAFGRFFSREYDWTHTQMYTLNEKTENFLASLTEDVKAYVILPADDEVARDTLTLLRNARTRTRKVDFELINPLVPENRARVQELRKKYGLDDFGVLVLAGDEKGRHDHEFIPFRKLYEEKGGFRGRGGQRVFVGEGAFLSAMTSLVEGQVVIYFTQGHGELALDAGGNPMMRRRGRDTESAGQMRDRLTKDRKKFDVRPLKLERAGTKIPDDASTVVVARPTSPLSPGALKSLAEYMARKEERDKDGKVKVAGGRLLVLLDPVVQTTGGGAALVRTGLEDFLAGHGVKVGDNRVQSLQRRDPLEVTQVANAASTCPVARAFIQVVRGQLAYVLLPAENIRTVEPMEGKGGPKVEPLLLAPAGADVWAETKFNLDPLARAQYLNQNPAEADKVLSDKNLPTAVTVVESDMPRDPIHGGLPGGGRDRPKMVVFGSAAWASDAGLAGQQGDNRFSLFSSCLSWLREQGDIGIEIKAKETPVYNMNIDPAYHNRLRYLPGALMMLAVVALGIGVWVVRRK